VLFHVKQRLGSPAVGGRPGTPTSTSGGLVSRET
jgi:hypothetical protein